MKKILLLSVLVFAFCFQGNSQVKTFKDLYEKYENDIEVKCLKISQLGNFLLSMCIPQAENDAVKRLVSNCSGASLLVSQGQKGKDLGEDATAYIKKSKLEELTTVKEAGKDIRIYAESKGKEILQIFVLVQANAQVVCVQLNGRFSTDMLKEIAKI